MNLAHLAEAETVWRQLLFPVSDNYFSRPTTITSFTNPPCRSKLVLAEAEDKALQGCNLSADFGARPGREAAAVAAPPVSIGICPPGMASTR
jgi:hypothetical protein